MTQPAAATALLTMADSAYPGNVPRKVNGKTPDIVLIYAGGNTVHPWTPAEIAAMPERWRWPCYVRSNPESHSAELDAAAMINWLRAHNVPRGTSVILDLEMAVNGPYVNAFDQALHVAGYAVAKYGSQSAIWRNSKTSGGTFVALPSPRFGGGAGAPGDGVMTTEGDTVARQWGFLGGYDLSVVKASVPLWDTRPPPPHKEPPRGRHEVDGTISLAGLARWCKTTPERILLLTARRQASWGDLQRPYVHAGDWSARLPAGTIVWLP